MRQAGVIVAALVVLLGAAACGGGGSGGGGDRLSKSEYEEQMRSIGADLQEASSNVDISSTTDLDKVADTVADFQDDLETAANNVDDLNPPEDAETETDKIADALHAFADEFGKMEKAARDRDTAALKDAQQAVISEGTDAQQAANDLKAKGYDIGELGAGG
jgi:hypothetical protein